MVSYAQLLLLTLLSLTATSAFPKDQRSEEISGKFSLAASRFLEALKNIMPCGDGQDVEVLAPYNIPFIPVKAGGTCNGFLGNATNVRIEGLDSFELLSAHDNCSTGLVTFDLLIRQIQVLGSAELEGFVNVGGFVLPLGWSGPFNDAFFDLRFVGNFSFVRTLTNPDGLRIEDFKQTIFLGGVDLNKRNSLWDAAANYFFEKIQSQITEEFFQDELISDYKYDLAHISMDELLSIMEKQAQIWESIKCGF